MNSAIRRTRVQLGCVVYANDLDGSSSISISKMANNTTTAMPDHSTGDESSSDDYDDYTEYGAYQASVRIFKVVPPIIITLGTFGNLLSVYILTRRSIRTSTTSVYLTVLAFSDLVVLYTGLMRQWIIFTFEIDVRDISSASCKIHLFMVYFSLDFSAWIIMAVTLERVISAWFPHRAKSTCTKKMAASLLTAIGVFLFAFNSHIMFGYGYPDESKTQYKCLAINDSYHYFFENAWAWLDLCAFCVVPFTFIGLGNMMILYKVINSRKKATQRVHPAGQGGETRRAKKNSMTPVLVTLNMVFLISTFPVSVYNSGYYGWALDADAETYANLELWWAIVNMLQYSNNSLNFVLYVLSGTRFRQEFIKLLKLVFRQDVEQSSIQSSAGTTAPAAIPNRAVDAGAMIAKSPM